MILACVESLQLSGGVQLVKWHCQGDWISGGSSMCWSTATCSRYRQQCCGFQAAHRDACPCRGFVRERPKPSRQLRDSQSSAADGRPLGEMVHVLGINHSISASAVFGDFYRCAAVLDSWCGCLYPAVCVTGWQKVIKVLTPMQRSVSPMKRACAMTQCR